MTKCKYLKQLFHFMINRKQKMSENVFTLFLTENIAREQYHNRTLYIYIHVVTFMCRNFWRIRKWIATWLRLVTRPAFWPLTTWYCWFMPCMHLKLFQNNTCSKHTLVYVQKSFCLSVKRLVTSTQLAKNGQHWVIVDSR